MVGSLPNVITCAKFQVEIFRGYDFTGGRISHFPIDSEWALQQCSATALPVINVRFFDKRRATYLLNVRADLLVFIPHTL